jgi:hypothetical protein
VQPDQKCCAKVCLLTTVEYRLLLCSYFYHSQVTSIVNVHGETKHLMLLSGLFSMYIVVCYLGYLCIYIHVDKHQSLPKKKFNQNIISKMANDDVHALLSYHTLTGNSGTFNFMMFLPSLFINSAYLPFYVAGPLDPNPVSELDRIVNDLRKKYRTYVVPYSGEHVWLT